MNCCLRSANTIPAPPTTGIHHPKCYARALADCAERISLEHYWSEAVLKLIAPKGSITLRDASGLLRSVPVTGAGSNVLCTRHNAALSQADEVALRFFQAIPTLKSAVDESLTRSTTLYFDGHSIERWMLKTLCCFLAAGLLKRTDGTPCGRDIPLKWVRILFGQDRWPETWGLYLAIELGAAVHFQYDELNIASLTQDDGSAIGAEMSLGGWTAKLILRQASQGQSHLYRPKEMKVQGPKATLTYRFYWAEGRRAA
jgi:hypothetical protein